MISRRSRWKTVFMEDGSVLRVKGDKSVKSIGYSCDHIPISHDCYVMASKILEEKGKPVPWNWSFEHRENVDYIGMRGQIFGPNSEEHINER